MAPVGWINDPNGFVYFQGEYHLFYQHYPYDSQWGPMHWGHAKSKDLIHWQELPVALAPDQVYDKDGCFSGSAIEKDGLLYLFYTGHVVEKGVTYQTQCLAISTDGIHFEKSANNPVIDAQNLGDKGDIHDFRDPKVIQHDEAYYMVVATKTASDEGRILMYRSADLLTWDFYSILLQGNKDQGIMWECPDLFHLDGQDVLILSPIQIKQAGLEYQNISSTMACLGQMNWQTGELKVETFHEMDFGFDFYAPQTTLDAKNRRVMIAWMQMWDRNMPTHELGHHWAGSMTLPRELHVREGRLIQKPVSDYYRELEYLYGFENISVEAKPVTFHKLIKDNTYLHLVVDLSQTASFEIHFAKSKNEGIIYSYDATTSEFSLSREKSGYQITGKEAQPLNKRRVKVPLIDNQLVLEVFRDTSSVEVFINGLATMTSTFYEIEKGEDISFVASEKAVIGSFEVGRVKISD
ncbi:glycoside hydrolase family 32 protein [Vagococcus sp. BWB3-3]|uniref:Sucrose-6-phosphate hydrolase n=2 Tax=Vagococcus allomyrinae TaxID=2794353 RepID=A0A940SRM3_9ENTE|nr:glycoside hydrolase family 32 protein [Vagococcus allomyrinae]